MRATIQAYGVGEKAYSQVITVPINERTSLAFVSGQVARDAQGQVVGDGDFDTQCRFVFEQLKRLLESVGSSLNNVLKLTVFLKDFSNYSILVDIRRAYLDSEHPPASTAVAISSLVDPSVFLEIE